MWSYLDEHSKDKCFAKFSSLSSQILFPLSLSNGESRHKHEDRVYVHKYVSTCVPIYELAYTSIHPDMDKHAYHQQMHKYEYYSLHVQLD